MPFVYFMTSPRPSSISFKLNSSTSKLLSCYKFMDFCKLICRNTLITISLHKVIMLVSQMSSGVIEICLPKNRLVSHHSQLLLKMNFMAFVLTGLYVFLSLYFVGSGSGLQTTATQSWGSFHGGLCTLFSPLQLI